MKDVEIGSRVIYALRQQDIDAEFGHVVGKLRPGVIVSLSMGKDFIERADIVIFVNGHLDGVFAPGRDCNSLRIVSAPMCTDSEGVQEPGTWRPEPDPIQEAFTKLSVAFEEASAKIAALTSAMEEMEKEILALKKTRK